MAAWRQARRVRASLGSKLGRNIRVLSQGRGQARGRSTGRAGRGGAVGALRWGLETMGISEAAPADRPAPKRSGALAGWRPGCMGHTRDCGRLAGRPPTHLASSTQG